MRAEKGKFRISKSIRILIVCMLVSASLLGGFFVVAQPGHDRYGPPREDPKVDTDGDGVPDYKDTDDDNDGLTDKFEEQLETDPKKADTDGDRLSDPDELIEETDPKNEDTDDDGWTDGEERERETYLNWGESHPNPRSLPPYDPSAQDTDEDRPGGNDEPPKTDTDGDGVPDYRDSDDDNDGLTDKYENQLGTDPKRADSDGDMVSDPDEFIDYTDPNDDDTDNDGWSDGAEKERETVPQDPESRPGKTYIPEYEPDDDE